MKLFIIVWVGQLIASIGSSITAFALDVWVYEHTGSVTQFAFITLANTLPLILLAPIAGLLVDRWDRRWTMILSDLFATLATVAIGILFIIGRLEVWHIYLANTFSAIFVAFQIPAFIASISLLVPKQHLGRANGMLSLMNGTARLLAPPLGGILLGMISLQGIIVLHLTSVFLGIAILLLLRFPKASTPAVAIEGSSFLKETTYGLTYLVARPGLLGVLIISAFSIFLVGGVQVITIPLVLSFAPVTVLGTILSLFGVAVLVGGLLIGIWGGLQRNMNMIYGCMLLTGVSLLVAGLQPSVVVFIFGVFLFFLIRPIIASSTQAIFQSKVEPLVQGRVFSIKGAIEAAGLPLGYIAIAPLAEVFEPLMATDGFLAGSIGQIIGVGTGRGMGLLFIIMGIFTISATCIAYFFPRLRLVEDELPDVVDGVAIAIPNPDIATDKSSSNNDAVPLIS
ncbi:MFS transporter [Nostoc sp. B(2019)]|nr:MFS transporter [Nostoc sp. B(2019)]